MKLIDVFTQILKDRAQESEDVLDVLLRAVLLHTHSLVLAENVTLEDVDSHGTPPRTVLAPLTRTHLAQILATLWPVGDKRHADGYWIKEYGAQTPFELFTGANAVLGDAGLLLRAAQDVSQRVRDAVSAVLWEEWASQSRQDTNARCERIHLLGLQRQRRIVPEWRVPLARGRTRMDPEESADWSFDWVSD